MPPLCLGMLQLQLGWAAICSSTSLPLQVMSGSNQHHRVAEGVAAHLVQAVIMADILKETCLLARDQYGNYVIQHVLEHGHDSERQQVRRAMRAQHSVRSAGGVASLEDVAVWLRHAVPQLV